MALNVIFRTSDYRGDHAADIAVAYEVKDGETVEQLAARLFGKEARGDVIEIRRVEPAP